MAYTITMGRPKGSKNVISGKIETVCLECKKVFLVNPCRFKNVKNGGVFCSRECKHKSNIVKESISLSHGGKLIVNCASCKKEFRTYPSRMNKNKENFCSSRCYGDYYSLPKEVLKQHKDEWKEKNKEHLVELGKKWREKNKEIIKADQQKRYLDKKEYYKEKAKVSAIKRYKRYKSDKDFNRYEVIKVIKFRQKKKELNPNWSIEVDRKNREFGLKQNKETKEMAEQFGQPWMGSEIEYLKENYLTKTRYEMAIHLGRSLKGIESKLLYCYKHYHWKTKQRKLKGIFY